MTLKENKYQYKRNLLRNNLKHLGKEENSTDEIEIDEQKQKALTHIAGAIINYKMYKKIYPKGESIARFRKEFGVG